MPNHLVDAKSPYLKQHAENPVDWHPWGEDAFKKAKKADKPIFLSIGYSTCHWCHVMAHESFEDEEVASRMNEVFISIKVDREERPDIDSVYMKAAMLATGRGGWPLSIFMTPEGEPFFAATYIPRDARYGMMGLIDLIVRIDHLWKNDREGLLSSSREIVNAMRTEKRTKGGALTTEVLDRSFDNFSKQYDSEFGGFGSQPKFPSPHQLLFLMRYHKRTKNPKALEMAERTLQAIGSGGINDNVGGGFHRYSTDRKWMVPHFEKMLYDQAMLISAFTEAYLITRNEYYKKTVERTIDYIQRDMTSKDGLFYSAEDADSEGEEGKFYVWDLDGIISVLGKDEGKKFASHFNVKKEGNFHDESSGRRTGKNILHLGIGSETAGFENDLEFLRIEREKRIRPSRDEKILTDWNALMISSLSKAGQAFQDERLIKMAVEAMNALENHSSHEGKWFHRFMDGERAVPMMLDDIAFLSLAYLDLYEATFEIGYLKKGIDLAERMVRDFFDKEEGGFYQTSMDSEVLISREKEAYDGAIPSGNSIAALVLIRVSRMTGRTKYEDMTERTFSHFSEDMKRAPTGFAMMLSTYMHAVGPSREIVIAEGENRDITLDMIDSIRKIYLPQKVLLLKKMDESGREMEGFAPFTIENIPLDGRTTAYVCEGWNCNVPTTDPALLKETLDKETY